MFEYELDSQHGGEERKNFDYDFSKEEFLNPIVVKGPDGTISVGTDIKSKEQKEALCWNCNSHLIFRNGAKKVRCYKCKEVNDMNTINDDPAHFLTCPDKNCKQDLLVPPNVYRIYCPTCNTIFVSPKYHGIYAKLDALLFFA